jgi:hypothetical protein
MRFMVIVKATKDSEAGVMPSAQLREDMGKFNQELMDAGVFVDAAGLQASSKGARVTFFRKRPHRDHGTILERPRSCGWILDLEGEIARRSHRVGQTLPEPNARDI